MTDSPADPPPTSTPNSPPAPAPPTQRPAPARGPTPRCPGCLYTLEGRPETGVCPECGRTYAAADRFLYLKRGGFWRTFAAFFWPALGTPLVFLIGGAASVFVGPLFVLLFLALLANSIWVSYRIAKRRRIRNMAPGETQYATAGLVAESIGCGLLAAITVFVVTFAVSCGFLFLIFVNGH